MKCRQFEGVTTWHLWYHQVCMIHVYHLWSTHSAQGKIARIFGTVTWLQIERFGKGVHYKIHRQCATGVTGESGHESSHPSRWKHLQSMLWEKNKIPTRGSGTNLPQHNGIADVHECQGTSGNIYVGGITHQTCEEIIRGWLGKTQTRVGVTKGKT